ncbi:hypothetical protein CsSME_00001785 [Camellia sinensis var. sinensis]
MVCCYCNDNLCCCFFACGVINSPPKQLVAENKSKTFVRSCRENERRLHISHSHYYFRCYIKYLHPNIVL